MTETSPSLLSLTTAVPEYELTQEDVIRRASTFLPGVDSEALERLMPVYKNSGIERRYSCVPPDWYAEDHGWEEKNRLYVKNAVDLIEEASVTAMEQAHIEPSEIDMIVSVSTTGIVTPSLEAQLMERVGFRRNCERLPVFGLGCAGGVIGLTRSFQQAVASPNKTILFVAVELCGLTFRRCDGSKANVIATALFGDGAAAAVINSDGNGATFENGGEFTWPNSLDVMGWSVEEDGLGVIFSRDIPTLTRTEFRKVLKSYLADTNLSLSEIDQFVCHPGGTKVLNALEEAFELQSGALTSSREVLRDYGNMSAVTVLFVLKNVLRENERGRFLLSSLGPGFTAAFMTLIA
ncbi:MAG: hypothetical protein CMM52_08290 [Rhodospirillaceae bacterium]|nr:hypothetical protein [Rhodospirillaceae bacterium]